MADPITVDINADGFIGSAYSLSEMPGEAVISVLADQTPEALWKTYELFKLAVIDPRARDQLQVISYGQVASVIQQWMTKSFEAATMVEIGMAPEPSDDQWRIPDEGLDKPED
jgi:hypothetical protein